MVILISTPTSNPVFYDAWMAMQSNTPVVNCIEHESTYTTIVTEASQDCPTTVVK